MKLYTTQDKLDLLNQIVDSDDVVRVEGDRSKIERLIFAAERLEPAEDYSATLSYLDTLLGAVEQGYVVLYSATPASTTGWSCKTPMVDSMTIPG
jgi:hypothetical protein